MKKTIHSPAQEAFCALLRGSRKEKSLTQVELAERLERPQSFVAKVEKGERLLDVIEFVHYSKALELDPVKSLKKLCADQNIWK